MRASSRVVSFLPTATLLGLAPLTVPRPAVGQTVSIYPQIGTVNQPASTSGLKSTFSVINGTSYTVSLYCGAKSPVACTRLSASSVGPHGSLVDTAVYSTSSAGSGIIKLYTQLVNSQVDSGYYKVTVLPQYQVVVTPKAGKTPTRHANTTGYGTPFTLKNTGYYTDTYTITCSTSGPVSCTGLKNTSLTVTSLDSAIDTAYYATGALPGTGLLTFRAASSHSSDAGADTVPVTPDVTPTGPVVARDLCLTIAVGPGAAYECGDLRIVHALPSVRTLNKVRSPTLLYSSQDAEPFVSLNADLTLAANDRPDSIIAIARLEVSGSFVQRDRRAWPGTAWGSVSDSATRRVMTTFAGSDLATGLYPFQLELDRFVTGTGYTAIRTDTGTVAIVNRLTSPFGAGWWLAGFEQLRFLSDTSLMWIGGDGSVRRYVNAGTWAGKTWYIARSLDAPDTLTFDSTTSTYTRLLKGGTRVVFNANGFQTETVNRLGYATLFTPDANSRLASITLPPATSALTYTFTYNGPNGTLSTVIAPDSAGHATRTTAVAGSAVGAGARVTSITDPGIPTSVQLGYANASYPAAITARTDRRGNTTTFSLDTALKLVRDSLPVAGAAPIVRTFCPAEIRIWTACSTGLTTPESTYTVYDGPRTDSTDITDFWLDSLGAVTQIRDPYGHLTTITRADTSWPELATRVQYPSGLIVAATYDARGNLVTVTDSNAYNDARNPTTQYVWDQTWDELKQLTLPNGQLTQFGIDPTNGNRLWVEDALGAVSRTTFQYYSSGNGIGLLSTIIPPLGARTSVWYDARGNADSVDTGGWTTVYRTDSIGRPTIVATPVATNTYRTDTTAYDPAGRVIREASYGPSINGFGAELATTYNTYDAEDNLYQVQRSQWPDPSELGWLTTQSVFDAADRATVDIAPDGFRDSTWYDPAGNADSTKTRNGEVLRMTYDRMNRLSQRVTPQVSYTARTSPGLLGTLDLPYDNYSPTMPHQYPWYPNDGSGLAIPADTARFGYDAGGQLIRADNGDARVHRSYFPAGLLASDSLWIRDYADTAFAKHLYVLTNVYDLNGRRVSLTEPAQLATGVGMQSHVGWGYSDTTGAIVSLGSPLGHVTQFAYDLSGALVRETLPGGIVDSVAYDTLGRMVHEQVVNGSTSPYKDPDMLLRDAALAYAVDPARVSSVLNTHGWKDTVTAWDNGLGQLRNLFYSRPSNVADSALYDQLRGNVNQSFALDPLGNTYSGYTTSTGSLGFGSWFSQGSSDTSTYDAATGRILTTIDGGGSHGFVYDSAGNTVFFYQAGGSSALNDRASWYGADGQLRVAEWRQALKGNNPDWNSPAWTDVFEEYRYDALGRRVLVMSRWACWMGEDSTSFADCQVGRVRRTVWDGDRELWEIQMPAAAYDSTWVENDTATVTSWAGPNYAGTYSDPNPLFGRVAYTYVGGVDAPVSVMRIKLVRRKTTTDTTVWNPAELYPRWNWRGEADIGTFADGGMETCTNSTHCVFVQWRGVAFATGLASELLWDQFRSGTPSPYGWFGTLIDNKEDGTQTFYRRNRVVDPMTGRFTQEDPIGLAGGINLYGYASGNPLTYSDPFGLAVCFQGSASQVSALEFMVKAATNSTFGLDKNNCIIASSFRSLGNHKFDALRARFEQFVDPTAQTWMVAYTREANSPQHTSYHISIAEDAEGRGFDTGPKFGRCDGGRVPFLFEQVFNHELVHHLPELTGQPMDVGSPANENRAVVRGDNEFNAAVGRRARCRY